MITVIYYEDGDLLQREFDTDEEVNEWLNEGEITRCVIVRGTDYTTADFA